MERIFLGWDRPALALAVDYLANRFTQDSQFDLENVVVVLPGSRAGRRLIERLVDHAASHGSTLIPPTIVTPATLADLLLPDHRREAGDFERLLIWRKALLSIEQASLANVFPQSPARDDLLGWISLAEILDRLHRELGGEDLDFQDVVAAGTRIPGFGEQARWATLALVQQAYRVAMQEVALVDGMDALRSAAREGASQFAGHLVLIAVAELAPKALRAILRQVDDRVTALVHAPREHANLFDDMGCLLTRPWRDSPLAIPNDALLFVDDAKSHAQKVVNFVLNARRQHPLEEITIGLPDDSLLPVLENHFEQAQITVRSARGTPMERTAPFRLLHAVANFLDERLFVDLASLVRHPDFLAAIERDSARSDDATDLLTFLDEYHNEHLQAQLPQGAFLEGSKGSFVGTPAEIRRLTMLCQQVAGMLRDFIPQKQRSLKDWGESLLALLLRVHGENPVDTRTPDGHLLVETLTRIHAVLSEFHRLSDSLAPRAGAVDAIRLTLRQLEKVYVPRERADQSIEMLGWLELQLDDAPVLIVAGMNDSCIPASVNADLFLPNNLRQQLGLLDNDRRFARDAYGLTAILASRPTVQLIASRRSIEGDPMNPSRLLFACDDATLVARIVAFYENKQGKGKPVLVLDEGSDSLSSFPVPKPRPLNRPIESLSVTAFRDYLACPYRFYLRHVLRLGSLDDSVEELDGRAFGNLAHDVLRDFGQSEAASETHVARIREFLLERLRQLAADRYGNWPMPAVRIQVEQLASRLEAFADWQANWAREGWQIAEVERSFTEPGVPFDVDQSPFYLRGRIDRMDVHVPSGRIAVFDYKTADAGTGPDDTHRVKEEWMDLQLPLYRHLLQAGSKPIDLGYIVLPKDMSKAGARLASWTPELLHEADEAARNVIRGVRQGRFWPRTDPAPKFSDEFASICQDGYLVADMNEDSELDE
ncbi:MAG: PD-(D/E)XK nuclease family protein [Planctomycetota bacterium]